MIYENVKLISFVSDNDCCPLSINTFSTDMICAVEGKEVDAPKAQRVTFLNNHFVLKFLVLFYFILFIVFILPFEKKIIY